MAKKIKIDEVQFPLLEEVSSTDKHYIRCRVLIVCEGEKTEPNYFRSFHMMKNQSDLVYEIKSEGGKINTIDVVNLAIQLRDKAKKEGKPYDSVWAVFDKDSFPNDKFNQAIKKAETNGIGCAWSNEAFELWYVYHFDDRNTPLSRTEYKSIITKRVKKNGRKPNYKYTKNDCQMRKILLECGDEEQAILRAQNQANQYQDEKFHTHNPATTVYKLVSLLKGKNKEFNDQIKKELSKK